MLSVALIATALAADQSVCRLLLVRHGETSYNREGRIQGRLESELTKQGHEQARALGHWLAAVEAGSVDQVFVSPRRRTRQTLANIETGYSAPAATVRAGLREIELTMWEGQLRSELKDGDGNSDLDRWFQWKAHPDGFRFAEDGHSPLGDVSRRAAEEWAALRTNTPAASTSMVVAHGAFNRVFLLTALGLPVDDAGFLDKAGHFHFENCGAVELL